MTTWTICTVSKAFAQELMVLCRAVGLNVKAKCAGPGEWGSLDRWILSSRSLDDPETTRYISRDLRGRNIGEGLWIDPIDHISDSEAETLDVEVEDVHEYTAHGFVSHNTVSLEAGVAPGGHFAMGEWYIRRKRVSTFSPFRAVLDAAGYPSEPDIYSDNTLVYEFPQSQPGVRTQAQAGVFEQALQLIMLQREWSDNAVSFTLEFDPKTEGAQLGNLLAQIAPMVKSVSVLPRSGHYPQAPYEEITEREFKLRQKMVKPIDWSGFTQEGSGEADKYCNNNTCEIRPKESK